MEDQGPSEGDQPMAGMAHLFRSPGPLFPTIFPHFAEKNTEWGVPIILWSWLGLLPHDL